MDSYSRYSTGSGACASFFAASTPRPWTRPRRHRPWSACTSPRASPPLRAGSASVIQAELLGRVAQPTVFVDQVVAPPLVVVRGEPHAHELVVVRPEAAGRRIPAP